MEAGIWVENNTNEYEMLHSLLVSKKRIGDDIVNVTIVPTYRCNMKCVYCFQVDENEKCTIEKQTCNSLLKVLYEQRNDYKS